MSSKLLICLFGLCMACFSHAATLPGETSNTTPLVTPIPPSVNAKSYILIDVNSGKILAEHNADEQLPPASLTKIMTIYLVSEALEKGNVSIDDEVDISKKAWRTGGSRMFIQEGTKVKLEDLIKGVVVQSGNDASVAVAEHIAGSEEAFADLMNQQAKQLNMTNSFFTNSTGLPDDVMYTTARDLAILGQATILNHPADYKWYSEKSFTYNDITQHNRNRLLWRNPDVDGLKTGHTNAAGYCLVSSAKQDDMRLLAVVMDAPSDSARVADSQRLLTYGFRFFDSKRLYAADHPIEMVRVWKGANQTIPIGVNRDVYITFPSGQYESLTINLEMPQTVQAPITKGQELGILTIMSADGKQLVKQPIVALENSEVGNFFVRTKDAIGMRLKQWFKQSE